jgi:Zn finger protein HypA/HybF involved in hydrogenase expression
MKIIQKGNLDFVNKPLKFSCKNCYTIFEANNREYEYCGDQREGDNWKCKCPLCHKTVYYS